MIHCERIVVGGGGGVSFWKAACSEQEQRAGASVWRPRAALTPSLPESPAPRGGGHAETHFLRWPRSTQYSFWSCTDSALCSGDNFPTHPGGPQGHSPPVNAQRLAGDQQIGTVGAGGDSLPLSFSKRWYDRDSLPVSIPERFRDLPFGSKVGREAGWGEVTSASQAGSLCHDHCLPATPNSNLVSQPLCN